ncbi:MAG: divalent cation tolerance protein CutA [Planctomycetes bacterium]|nr:divalent cation tolerance protein CutA [Planctomycetota bacterium]
MKIVLVTAPADVAEELVAGIVENRFAACAALVAGVRSVYRWKGSIECSDEVMIVVKTSDSAVPALMQHLARVHPYEVPEIVVVPVECADERYAKWVEDESSASCRRSPVKSLPMNRLGRGASPGPVTLSSLEEGSMAAKKAAKKATKKAPAKKVAKKATKKAAKK